MKIGLTFGYPPVGIARCSGSDFGPTVKELQRLSVHACTFRCAVFRLRCTHLPHALHAPAGCPTCEPRFPNGQRNQAARPAATPARIFILPCKDRNHLCQNRIYLRTRLVLLFYKWDTLPSPITLLRTRTTQHTKSGYIDLRIGSTRSLHAKQRSIEMACLAVCQSLAVILALGCLPSRGEAMGLPPCPSRRRTSTSPSPSKASSAARAAATPATSAPWTRRRSPVRTYIAAAV